VTDEKLDTIIGLLKQLVSKDGIEPQVFSVRQAAVYSGRSDKVIRRAIRRGELLHSENGAGSAGKWLVRRKDLDRWIERETK
jgi:excisionase family DNA binding protein